MSRYSAPFANAAIRYIAEIWLSAAEYSDLLIGGRPIQIVGLPRDAELRRRTC